jgi:hypothetical protein
LRWQIFQSAFSFGGFMSFSFKIFGFVLLFVSISFSQELSREQKLQKIDELSSQIKILETDVLSPDAKDLKQAAKEGFEVFRLMPREKYDRKLTINGGGAYYSFRLKTSEYGRGSDISLEQNNLKVGFAGADYGFIYDLGTIPLSEVSENTVEANFLLNYKPPAKESEVRNEAQKAYNYETDGLIYKSRVPDVVGNTYLLRSIDFDDWDILVAFKIIRKDTDGSLIIFWKVLKQFEKPILIRSEQSYLNNAVNFVAVKTDSENNPFLSGNLAAKIEEKLRKKGFDEVKVQEENQKIVLRGKIPKGKMAEVIQFVTENSEGKPVRNELTEK